MLALRNDAAKRDPCHHNKHSQHLHHFRRSPTTPPHDTSSVDLRALGLQLHIQHPAYLSRHTCDKAHCTMAHDQGMFSVQRQRQVSLLCSDRL